MIAAAVEAHASAGENPTVTSISGITVEQSPSGNPDAKAKGNVLGVSAQLRLQPTSCAYDPPEQVIAEEMLEGDDGGGGGLGEGGEGGGGEGGGGGTGQAVWQTYLFLLVQDKSFHVPESYATTQFSCVSPLGSRAAQLKYDSSVLDGLHNHVPSDAASVPPIHTVLPAAAVTSSAFCAADSTVASCRPAVVPGFSKK